VRWIEGTRFRWPVASPAYFDPQHAGGGVLMDIGVHVFDLLHWWFGDLSVESYEDDALGGIETNCVARLSADARSSDPSDAADATVSVEVRLSRDLDLRSRCEIVCDRGVISWKDNDPLAVHVTFESSTSPLQIADEPSATGQPPITFERAFVVQYLDVASAVREKRVPRVTAASSIGALIAIERCYRSREPLRLPWLGADELAGADALRKGGPA
jgi:predicted dehydrogenase